MSITESFLAAPALLLPACEEDCLERAACQFLESAEDLKDRSLFADFYASDQMANKLNFKTMEFMQRAYSFAI